jgi:hypothetical protein
MEKELKGNQINNETDIELIQWKFKRSELMVYHYNGRMGDLNKLKQAYPKFDFRTNKMNTKIFVKICEAEFELYKDFVICFLNDEPIKLVSYAKFCAEYEPVLRKENEK